MLEQNARQNHASIAKISCPGLSGILPRERLFRLLEQGRRRPVTWISGPAGAGKTTLVSSYLDIRGLPCLWYQVDEGDSDISTFFYYMGLAARKAAPRYKRTLPLLTPEYLLGTTAFSRRYFEELYSRLISPEGFSIVFDNYQNVPAGSPFHELMRGGLSIIPEGIQVILISRSEPPPALVGLRAEGKMGLIGWDEMRFTPEETRAFVRNRKQKAVTAEAIRRLHEMTAGWAAGLVLFLEKLKRDPGPARLDACRPEELFSYFAGEIFDKLNGDTRAFLLVSSFLPRMTIRAAGELSGSGDAGRILSDLSRNNFFTERLSGAASVYQYHPLFRQFLLQRAKESLRKEDLLHARKLAASLLLEGRQTEDAAGLFIDAEDWPGLISLILGSAQDLLAQGRSNILSEWLARIPEKILENTPWLLFWLGASRQGSDPAASRAIFERAFAAFERGRDRTGMLLSWTGIVEAYWYAWNEFTGLDPWIAWFDRNVSLDAPHPSPDVETRTALAAAISLVIRQPSHPHISRWFDRAIALSRGSGDSMMRLRIYSIAIYYYAWTGELKRAEAVIQDFRHLARLPHMSPFVQLTWRTLEQGMRALYTEESGAALGNFTAALAFAREHGIHTWDHLILSFAVYCCLSSGDVKRSDEYFRQWEALLDDAHRHGGAQYHIFLGWRHVLAGDHGKAVFHGELGLRIAEETGYVFPILLCRFILAQILMLGPRRHPDAAVLLSRSLKDAARMKSRIFQHMCLTALARNSFERGRDAEGLAFLTKGLAIGREEHYTKMYWWWHAPSMAELCARALDAGIEAEYARELIATRRLAHPGATGGEGKKTFRRRPGPGPAEAWPWPVRIYTLGRFELVIDNEPLRFTGKPQKKPLELLKALIAFGGRFAAEERISDALWPEADGDLARRSLDTTLYRLRRILGDDRFILIKDGVLSLNAGYCWVDAWEFERAADSVEFGARGAGPKRRNSTMPAPDPRDAAERALALYRGGFLPDARQSWVLTPRESLRNAYLRLVKGLGRGLADAGAYEEAARCFQKGLDVDELAEEFYQELMLCHLRLGQEAEAARVYRHCCAVLRRTLGAGPSSKTTKLYRTATDGLRDRQAPGAVVPASSFRKNRKR